MSRGKSASKRIILPDARYGSELVGKFTNFLMIGGKKTTAQNIVYKTLEMVAEKKGGDALELFEKIMEAVRPVLFQSAFLSQRFFLSEVKYSKIFIGIFRGNNDLSC